MTSKLTREENVQAVFDLKAGYTLGLADVEILKRVARMALAAMDSEPVAWEVKGVLCQSLDEANKYVGIPEPLYLHAQPAPVVSKWPEKLEWSHHDDITQAEALAWNNAIEACRAAMLHGGALTNEVTIQVGNSPVIPDAWIPVSERMPAEFEAVIAFDGDQVYGEAMYSSDDGFTIDGYEPCDRVKLRSVTHWMPLPAAPQEVKGD
ncbi:DUF551 domain-containing protein [Klebsiella michiganensis]|uniref:DUF551 domain-containing protein n=1 Tax=Klebsiella michiganensis TaxID=1134687 RepID=A0AAJ1KYB4_9ENTR|nr:DUF551 domain-containing protein [Klebsiella michiganensis]MDH0967057.1 DUF551 domain-containing protein [Klebsiella michiganensis]